MTRNLTYDGLRGWLLIIIACNHLYGSFVTQITRTPLGFVSAAEGFVFLSGFIAYLVYGRLSHDQAQLKRKIWRRSLTIYGFHITAILLSFSLVWLFPLYVDHWSEFFNAANWFSNPIQSAVSALLLLEQPGYHDILVLYLIPMLFLPFAILKLKKGQAWQVATCSVSVWLVAQFIDAQSLSPLFNNVFSEITINVSYFDPFAWQIYFYSGLLLSYLKFDRGYTFSFPLSIQITLLACAAGFFVIRHGFGDLMTPFMAGHRTASVVFQVNLLLAVYLIMLLMRRLPVIFTLKYPVFLGQHALPVFAFHAVVIYFLQPWSQPYTSAAWRWDLLICLLFVGLLAIPAKLDQLWRARRNKETVALHKS